MSDARKDHEPSWRKPVGMLMILLIIALWAVIVASLSSFVGTMPVLAQTIFYLFCGLVWIAPMRPLLIWMETGRWRA